MKLVSQDVGLGKESGCGLGQGVAKKVARLVGTLAPGAPSWPGAQQMTKGPYRWGAPWTPGVVPVGGWGLTPGAPC